jgi:hypothetical protein
MADKIVNIYFPQKPDGRRKGIFATRREDEIFGRRTSGAAITFYDLAQLNVGTAESAVWQDLPILKTPGYISYEDSEGIWYEYDKFTNADYQNYLDLLMEVPVTDWKYFYKRLDFELNELYPGYGASVAIPATYPGLLQMEDNEDFARQFMIDAAIDRTSPTGAADAQANIDDIGYAWTSRGLEYSGINKIEISYPTEVREWFAASTQAGFKITTTFDSDAADVSPVTVSGNVEVYLIPAPTFWAAVGEDVDNSGFYYKYDVLFAYQAAPRKNWRQYFDPYQLLDQDTLNEGFIDYQKNRAGMVVSQWEGGNVAFDENIVDPSEWDVTEYSSHAGVDDHIYFPGFAGTTHIIPDGGFSAFEMTDPMLVAVMKIRGTFYYLWKMTDADAESNAGEGYTAESPGY